MLEGWARRGNRDEDRRNSALPDQSPKCSGCSLVSAGDLREWAKRGARATHDIHSQPGAILLLRYRVRAEGRFALLGSTISAHPPLGTLTRNRCPPVSVAGEEIPQKRPLCLQVCLLHPNARAPLRLYRSPHNRRASVASVGSPRMRRSAVTNSAKSLGIRKLIFRNYSLGIP